MSHFAIVQTGLVPKSWNRDATTQPAWGRCGGDVPKTAGADSQAGMAAPAIGRFPHGFAAERPINPDSSAISSGYHAAAFFTNGQKLSYDKISNI